LAEVTKLDPKHLSHNFTFTSIEMKKLMYTSGCRAGRTATQQPGCQTRVSATEAPTRYGAVERSQDAPWSAAKYQLPAESVAALAETLTTSSWSTAIELAIMRQVLADTTSNPCPSTF